MPSFSNTIKTTIDVVSAQATASLKSFRTQIDEADGATGKLKAGFSATGDFIKAHAAALAVSAGTALVGFAAQATKGFYDLGLEAGNLADRLGISSAAASRWIEVAGDVGVSSDTIATAMGRLEKTAGTTPKVFDELGVSIAHTKDGTVDANATFLNTLERLKAIKDPTLRAAAGTKLLGKNWAELAELLNGDVRSALANVSDAKVIDDEEVKKAREFRDLWDDTKDKLENFSLAVGETVLPAVADIIKGFEDVGKTVGKVKPVWNFLSEVFGQGGVDADKARQQLEGTAGWLEKLTTAAEDATPAVQDQADSDAQLADAMDAVGKATKEATRLLQEHYDLINSSISSEFAYKNAVNKVEDAAADLYGKVLTLNQAQGRDRAGALEEVSRSEDDLLQAYVAQSTAAADLWGKSVQLAGGAWTVVDAQKAQRDELLKVRDTLQPGSSLYESVSRYIDVLDSVPSSVGTRVDVDTSAALEKIGSLIRKIGSIPGLSGLGKLPFGATGGIVTRPTLAMIGEAGPEAVVPLNQTPGSSPLGSGGPTNVFNVSITVPDGPEAGRRIYDALNAEFRRRGKGQL